MGLYSGSRVPVGMDVFKEDVRPLLERSPVRGVKKLWVPRSGTFPEKGLSIEGLWPAQNSLVLNKVSACENGYNGSEEPAVTASEGEPGADSGSRVEPS